MKRSLRVALLALMTIAASPVSARAVEEFTFAYAFGDDCA